jgi:hypothetical protein
MVDELNWIEQAQQAGTDLKDSIREAHGVLRDLKQVRREMEALRREMQHIVDCVIPEKVASSYELSSKMSLEKFCDSVEAMADSGIETVVAFSKEMLEKQMSDTKEIIQEFVDGIKDRGL